MTSVADAGTPGPTTERILPTRARRILPLCAAVLFGLAVHRLWLAEGDPRPYFEMRGHTMGTTWSVKLADTDLLDGERNLLLREIEAELEHVNALMSTWREDSELSRFNASTSLEPFAVSKQTLEVFEIAQTVSRDSGGAFDVTVGPLVAAWGFGATDRVPEPPSEEERAAIEGRVGFEKLVVDSEAGALRKEHPNLSCDLSAIAKGHGVDRVAQLLDREGHRGYLVEIGGELRARGTRRDGRVWRVGVERPDTLSRASQQVIELRDVSLATSGDYRDFYEVDGQRISHTIDPRAGRPIDHRLASVSVLHEEAVWADALATTLNVLGPHKGFRWAEERNLAALLLVREGDGEFHEMATAAWKAVGATPTESAAEARP